MDFVTGSSVDIPEEVNYPSSNCFIERILTYLNHSLFQRVNGGGLWKGFDHLNMSLCLSFDIFESDELSFLCLLRSN